MLWPARKARQDQKWWIGIMSNLFGRIRRYYALLTSHDVVVPYICLQLQICVELLVYPSSLAQKSTDNNRPTHVSTPINLNG